MDPEKARAEIRAKLIELAARRKIDATGLGDDEIIPETGYLDSAAIVELLVWIEEHFRLRLKQREITIENFGTVNAMVRYLGARG